MTRAYLAACAPYRDDAVYLAEWIEFHRLVGVERFLLYDNMSRDDHLDVLRPYVDAGVAVVEEWPLPVGNVVGRPSGLTLAFEHCLDAHGDGARWIAFLDVDEFLFSPGGDRVTDVLRNYEQWPGVSVSRANYGSSGRKTMPDGLVIESYVHRRHYPADVRGVMKCVVDPTRTVRCASVHQFAYRDGFAVDEHGRTLEGDLPMGVGAVSFERLRINHYGLKSEEELLRKRSLWEEAGAPRQRPKKRGEATGYDVVDPVLERYAADVRAAIEETRALGRPAEVPASSAETT